MGELQIKRADERRLLLETTTRKAAALSWEAGRRAVKVQPGQGRLLRIRRALRRHAKVSGIYVSPAEVEAALITHEAVLEAAVVGAEDESKLIKPKAFVVLSRATPQATP